MADFKDFTMENGNTDWMAYHKAQIEDGEVCYQCDSYITSYLFNKIPGRTLCFDCKNLDESNEKVEHSNLLRCPKCCYSWTAITDCEDYELYNEGDHEVSCRKCNHNFTIETYVSYSFDSPALLPKEK